MRFIYIILIGLLFACSNSSFEQEQLRINELIAEYDSLFITVENIDISSAGVNLKRYKESLEYSQSKLSTEKKPSLKTMTFLNDMKLMKRQFRNAPRQHKGFIKNIIRNQEQLENLRNDINNSIFNKEEINAIVLREEQAYEALSIKVKEFQIAYPSYEARFDSLFQLTETFNYE
ncbi:MAG: hypothetical protein P8I29_02340 [Flavobacteriales bacterium]|nr:hypothetical protein [Flavobacteriales bacterium]|tara:strand:- start:1510 stop:2034 length:525 start_codon:yes stop_codon:yes gene_type:complete